MGIRIHKELGWGLTDLACDPEGRLTDPRIHPAALHEPPDGFQVAYHDHLTELRTGLPDEFGEPLDITLEVGSLEHWARSGVYLGWPVVYDTEGGRPEVLLVRPPSHPDWRRYDDPVDYAEENALHNPLEPRVVPLRAAPFPFAGAYMDDRDGRTVNTAIWQALELLLNGTAEQGETPDRSQAAQELADLLGYENAEQARRHTAPQVPGEVRRFCAWAGLFTGPDVWRQLRPLLYVYWG